MPGYKDDMPVLIHNMHQESKWACQLIRIFGLGEHIIGAGFCPLSMLLSWPELGGNLKASSIFSKYEIVLISHSNSHIAFPITNA